MRFRASHQIVWRMIYIFIFAIVFAGLLPQQLSAQVCEPGEGSCPEPSTREESPSGGEKPVPEKPKNDGEFKAGNQNDHKYKLDHRSGEFQYNGRSEPRLFGRQFDLTAGAELKKFQEFDTKIDRRNLTDISRSLEKELLKQADFSIMDLEILETLEKNINSITSFSPYIGSNLSQKMGAAWEFQTLTSWRADFLNRNFNYSAFQMPQVPGYRNANGDLVTTLAGLGWGPGSFPAFLDTGALYLDEQGTVHGILNADDIEIGNTHQTNLNPPTEFETQSVDRSQYLEVERLPNDFPSADKNLDKFYEIGAIVISGDPGPELSQKDVAPEKIIRTNDIPSSKAHEEKLLEKLGSKVPSTSQANSVLDAAKIAGIPFNPPICDAGAVGIISPGEELEKFLTESSKFIDSSVLAGQTPALSEATTTNISSNPPSLNIGDAHEVQSVTPQDWPKYQRALQTPELEAIELHPAYISKQIELTRDRLAQFDRQVKLEVEFSPLQHNARDIAELYAENAEAELKNGNTSSSAVWVKWSKVAVDLALDFYYPTSVVKGILEATTGTGVVSGEALSTPERLIALATILPLGSIIKHVRRTKKAAEVVSKANISKALELSPQEIADQASKFGISPEVFVERRNMAIEFYSQHPDFAGTTERIGDHLRGIDFSKVEVKTIKAGEIVEQWQFLDEIITGRIGNYAAPIGKSSPHRLGIEDIQKLDRESLMKLGFSDREISQMGEIYSARIPVQYQAKRDTKALYSSANEIFVDWSSTGPKVWQIDPYYKGALDETKVERFLELRNRRDAVEQGRSGYKGLTKEEQVELEQLQKELPLKQGTYQPGGDDQYFINSHDFERLN